MAEIHENIDLALDSRSILDAAMELLVPANYIHALTQQLSSKAERFSNQTGGSAEHMVTRVVNGVVHLHYKYDTNNTLICCQKHLYLLCLFTFSCLVAMIIYTFIN